MKVSVIHIDNPVLITNIDENRIFIDKTHQALDNLIRCYKKNMIKKHSSIHIECIYNFRFSINEKSFC